MMKNIFIILIYLIVPGGVLFSQKIVNRDCGTPEPSINKLVDSSLMLTMAPQYTSPLIIKVFVHVVANDDGTSVAAGDSSIMRQLENMQQFYAPHQICFILAGYEQINSTDLNSHNVDTEAGDLSGFLVSNTMNIFFHNNLSDNDGGLNGSAYGIPNWYLSVSRGAVTSTTNRSTTAHEMGHCFGLYHTFRRRTDANNNIIREAVDRSGSCKNCTTEGDLLCDTEADPDGFNNYDVSDFTTNCNYTGSLKDQCNVTYNSDPHNIMAYGVRACRDLFTTGQGNRAESFITTTPFLQNAIAPDAVLVNSNQSYNTGRQNFLARTSVTINTTSFTVSGSARMNVGAGAVTLYPGVTLTPSSGYAAIRANTLCQ